MEGDVAAELTGKAIELERRLQHICERNLETLLGVRFLCSEFSTSNGGRIDTLGLDENYCPVIIEYKRNKNENVINQGLFYLDWLMDHRRDYEWLALEKYGKDVALKIEWSAPRLICIASNFTKYDEHAVNQMNRNIELIRYKQFDENLLLLELLTAANSNHNVKHSLAEPVTRQSKANKYKTVSESLIDATDEVRALYHELELFLLELGDDVQKSPLKYYFAFKRMKNFACVEVFPNIHSVRAHVKIDPKTVELRQGFTRDVSNIGHFGTGDLEITLTNEKDLEAAKPLLIQSYEVS